MEKRHGERKKWKTNQPLLFFYSLPFDLCLGHLLLPSGLSLHLFHGFERDGTWVEREEDSNDGEREREG